MQLNDYIFGVYADNQLFHLITIRAHSFKKALDRAVYKMEQLPNPEQHILTIHHFDEA